MALIFQTIFFNPGIVRNPRPYYYWHVGYLQGIRFGDWKLNLLAEFDAIIQENISKSTYKIVEFPDKTLLYNLRSDPGEKTDVADQYPEIVNQLIELVRAEETALGVFNDKGPEVREAMVVESPKTLIE